MTTKIEDHTLTINRLNEGGVDLGKGWRAVCWMDGTMMIHGPNAQSIVLQPETTLKLFDIISNFKMFLSIARYSYTKGD